MKESINILLLEDNLNDAELVQYQILKAGIKFHCLHTIKLDDFIEALSTYKPDLILSDYHLIGFTGMDALMHAKQKCPSTPFIVVTGALDDETAVEIIKNGAWDYVVKERLIRLGTVINNALVLKKERENNAIAREKLKTSEERFMLSVEGSNDGIWDYNIETNEVYYSERWKSMLGYKGNEIGNNRETWESLLHPDDKTNALAILEKHLKNETPHYETEFRLKCKDGSYKWILARGKAMFSKNGKPYRIAGSHTDISERKKAEKELLIAKEKAEQSDELKTAFLMNMSHEIRTPLNAIVGFSELLTKSNLDDKERSAFSNYITINGQSLAKIIDDIIDISKIQSNQMKINLQNFDLHSLLNEIETYYSSLLLTKSNENQTKIELELPDSTGNSFHVKTDENRLKQVLNNLISNAIKYTKKGKITVGYKQIDNMLHFYVKDTGIGISSKNIKLIFKRFVSFSEQHLSKHEGTGLGLPISKDLVSLLGGELTVESVESKGSTFLFNIPFEETKIVKKINPHSDENKVVDLSNYKILIADDEDSNYVLTKRLLKETKVVSDWAQNGKHAVEMATSTTYNLIIMDIRMPDMDGIEATKIIKKNNKDIPIIIQTAFAVAEAKERAFKAGCDGFISKPISIDAFLKVVNKHIKQ